jgi:hypothetical protein
MMSWWRSRSQPAIPANWYALYADADCEPGAEHNGDPSRAKREVTMRLRLMTAPAGS